MSNPNQELLKNTPPVSMEGLKKISDLIETVHRLRAPGGCPWDREQTHQSLRQYVVEEAFEVVDVLDKIDQTQKLADPQISGAFKEELGDLWMQVLLHSEMASEGKYFDVFDVAQTLNEKLIRRHPHVFGEVKAESVDSAFSVWEKQKALERKKKGDAASVLDGVPKGLPGLQRAARVLEKVTRVGFQWSDLNGPLSKVDEEWSELREAIGDKMELGGRDIKQKEDIASELGDLLFTLCNLAYVLKINPEDALRGTLGRFEGRFRFVEKKLAENGKTPDQSDLTEMDVYWNEAKKAEKEGSL